MLDFDPRTARYRQEAPFDFHAARPTAKMHEGDVRARGVVPLLGNPTNGNPAAPRCHFADAHSAAILEHMHESMVRQIFGPAFGCRRESKDRRRIGSDVDPGGRDIHASKRRRTAGRNATFAEVEPPAASSKIVASAGEASSLRAARRVKNGTQITASMIFPRRVRA